MEAGFIIPPTAGATADPKTVVKCQTTLKKAGAKFVAKKLGALAVGGPKMKLQKRCVQEMFETKGTVLDLMGVYDVALEES